MTYDAKTAERDHLLATAKAMAAAARTAPKTKGQDYVETAILDGEDLERLAAAMEEEAAENGLGFLIRDAGCVRKSGAVVLLGIGHHCRGMGKACNFCGLGDCAGCQAAGGACVFDPVDLGIALGSAAAVAADARVDSRIMMSAGLGAKRLGLFPAGTEIVFGIPLSISGKSPYFDR